MIETLLTIALIGVFVWALVTFIPMPGPIRTLLIAAAALYVVFRYILPILAVRLP